MESDNQTFESELILDVYSTADLQNLYRQISVSDHNNFDELAEQNYVIKIMELKFDSDFKTIDSQILIRDINKLNLQFVSLLKYCKEDSDFKKINIIFTVFCDYFDLPYNLCFKAFHEKLQNLIVLSYQRVIGLKEYGKIEERLNPISERPMTLFDLVKRKEQKYGKLRKLQLRKISIQ